MLDSVLCFLDALGYFLSVFCVIAFFLFVVASLVDWGCEALIEKGRGDE